MKRFLLLLLFMSALVATAQPGAQKKSNSKANKYSSLPIGYSQVGSTNLYYKMQSPPYGGIDIMGYYQGYYYSSTYGDYGYKLAIKVGNNSAVLVDCAKGTTNNGVNIMSSVEQQGDLARISYKVKNTNVADVVVMLGTYADVMIGNNDRAPISRRIDTSGQTYGLTMKDGDGAQLCVLFGSGLSGVTAVSDFWFGNYSLNSSATRMVGNYLSGSNYMEEDGSYDSGMGWCWKGQTIKAGSTVVFSYLIGVGEVNLEPNSSFEVTPDDPEGWNDLSRPHLLTLDGTYESPAGLDGVIDYAVEDNKEWIALTDVLASGDTFSASLVATFNPTRPIHTVRFRTRDLVGNTTLLPPIEYKDVSFYPVSGVEDKVYTGDSIYQEGLSCELEANQYVAKNYNDNVTVGEASFLIEGVFPKTIGRKKYTFNILPQPLNGSLILSATDFVYSGNAFAPEWRFSNSNYSSIKAGKDYTVVWTNNILPGTGKLTVTGKGNYTGVLTASIYIDKAPLTANLYTLTLPKEDITYDGQSHGASIVKQEGVGTATITYQKQGSSSATSIKPNEAGDYTIYLAFADGTLYHGMERTQVGSFSIYQFSEEEWGTLQSLHTQLTAMGWSQPWNISKGVKSVSSLQGITIEKGHVTRLNLAGKNLTGQFPYEIFALSQLKRLDIERNHLSGDIRIIPSQYTKNSLQELNISDNKLSGNIGLFANQFTNLNFLDASNNCLEEVIPMIPSTVTSLNISKQTIARVVPLHLAKLSATDIAAKMPTILFYDHVNRTYSTNISLLGSTKDESFSMSLVFKDGQLSMPYVSKQNTYYGESGDTLNVAVLKSDGIREGSTFRISLSFDEGDSNFDGQVNVLDLQAILNYMFEEYTNKPYNFTASNLLKDEIINVQDAVCLVNMLLDANIASAHQAYAARRIAAQSLESASVSVENGYLTINSLVPVSAFDIVVSSSRQAEVVSALNDKGFICASRQSGNDQHIVGYSPGGAEIPAGQTAICKLSSGIVSYAMLADRDANAISVSLNGETTTGVQSSMLNSSSQEIYRIPLGTKRAIIIDATGRKTIIKD